MKILKKVIWSILGILILSAIGGYIYFDQKFSPEKNYLTVKNESGSVPFKWLGNEKNVLLLPIRFENDTTKYYLQFDTGSPYTVFYSNPIKNIRQISLKNDVAATSFTIGKTKVSSSNFKIYKSSADNDNKSLKIIGTIGADILENRKTIINFKQNYISLNLSKIPSSFQSKPFDFKFKKRKIIFDGFLKGKEGNFLYDSGSSAYELLTNKEVWQELKQTHSKINIEKSQSWDHILTTYTANCTQKIQIGNCKIPLNKVTYVEGYSQTQYYMMKFSGMTGMLGNRLFLNNILYIDCTQNNAGID